MILTLSTYETVIATIYKIYDLQYAYSWRQRFKKLDEVFSLTTKSNLTRSEYVTIGKTIMFYERDSDCKLLAIERLAQSNQFSFVENQQWLLEKVNNQYAYEIIVKYIVAEDPQWIPSFDELDNLNVGLDNLNVGLANLIAIRLVDLNLIDQLSKFIVSFSWELFTNQTLARIYVKLVSADTPIPEPLKHWLNQ